MAAGFTTIVGSAAAAPGPTCNVSANILKPKPEKAVSLVKLCAVVSAGGPANLSGLTRLDGFITDPNTRDVILWGLSERGKPDLRFEDFAVALRAAYGRYYETRGGTPYIATPLISIDPDPDMFRALHALDINDPASKRKFSQVCGMAQTVRVDGMPRNTRVAKVLVDADYRMKMVSQGTVTLPIKSPFPSQHGAQLAEWRAAAARGQASQDHATNTRYWFEAGRFNYQGSSEADITFLDGDTVFFDTAEVVLRDEDQRLQAQGLAASGSINPISRAFACAWTRRMEDVYRAEMIWREMHNIYRHFAVARAIFDRKAFVRVGFAGGFLLDRYNVPQIPLPPTLPGLGRIDGYDAPVNGAVAHYSSWVCGGVSIDFSSSLSAAPATREARDVRSRVLAQRPGKEAISWSVR